MKSIKILSLGLLLMSQHQVLNGQAINGHTDRFRLVLGMKYNSSIEQFGESGALGWALLMSPIAGVEYKAKNIPASISFQMNKAIIPSFGGG